VPPPSPISVVGHYINVDGTAVKGTSVKVEKKSRLIILRDLRMKNS
jgi:hypothetical protein